MQRKRTSWLLCAVLATLVAGCLLPATSGNTPSDKPKAANSEQRRLLIRTGTLFTKDGVPISLSGFDAAIESNPSPQDSNSSASKHIEGVQVRSGTAFVRASDMGKLLQSHVPPDKISDLAVETSNNELRLSGKLKKTIPVHFEIKGPLTLTPEGLLALHESSMKVDKLPVKGLADLFGMDPASVAADSSSKGIKAEKDQLIFDPNLLWGMSVQGKLTSVKVTPSGLLLSYGTVRHAEQQASRREVHFFPAR
jgi:hypothetical protein